MRRMKEMAALQPGMSFYGDMPDSYTVVVNTDSPLVATVRDQAETALAGTVQPLIERIDADSAAAAEIRKAAGDKAPSAEDDQKIKDLEKASTEAREQQNKAIDDYAATAPRVAQMVDLALLGNGLLRGADLSRFIARSFELMA